jgi:chemotaxis protein CheZ
MTIAQDTIGKTFLRGLISTLESKGNVSLEDVGSIFQDVAQAVNAGDPQVDQFVRSEINKLASYIGDAKREIVSIAPELGKEGDPEFFAAAGEELSAVVKSTEEATNKIMDATDAIIAALDHVKDIKVKQIIDSHAAMIYNACSFQDITGQRINKVIKTLDYVEIKIAKLAKLFGSVDQNIHSLAAKNSDDVLHDTRPDAHLMEGPQLENKGVSQSDIDALFG